MNHKLNLTNLIAHADWIIRTIKENKITDTHQKKQGKIEYTSTKDKKILLLESFYFPRSKLFMVRTAHVEICSQNFDDLLSKPHYLKRIVNYLIKGSTVTLEEYTALINDKSYTDGIYSDV